MACVRLSGGGGKPPFFFSTASRQNPKKFNGLMVSLRRFFLRCKHHIPRAAGAALMQVLDAYNQNECSRTEMQRKLRELVPDAVLKRCCEDVRHAAARKAAQRKSVQQPMSSCEALCEQTACKVCFTNEANCLLRPCSHLVVCHVCSRQVTKCPVCRQSIRARFPVYRQ